MGDTTRCVSRARPRRPPLGDQGRHLPGAAANRARRRLSQGRRLAGPLPGPRGDGVRPRRWALLGPGGRVGWAGGTLPERGGCRGPPSLGAADVAVAGWAAGLWCYSCRLTLGYLLSRVQCKDRFLTLQVSTKPACLERALCLHVFNRLVNLLGLVLLYAVNLLKKNIVLQGITT